MVRLLVLLLIFFLVAYFGVDILSDLLVGSQGIEIAGVATIPSQPIVSMLSNPTTKVFLGGAVFFLIFAVILFSMLDQIVDTIRETIRPLARLIPLGAFLASIYYTFGPFISALFSGTPPGEVGASLAQAVDDGTLTRGILLTLGTMILFLMANRILGTETSEVRALRAELAKYRRALK